MKFSISDGIFDSTGIQSVFVRTSIQLNFKYSNEIVLQSSCCGSRILIAGWVKIAYRCSACYQPVEAASHRVGQKGEIIKFLEYWMMDRLGPLEGIVYAHLLQDALQKFDFDNYRYLSSLQKEEYLRDWEDVEVWPI
jgi:hypothetical protein